MQIAVFNQPSGKTIGSKFERVPLPSLSSLTSLVRKAFDAQSQIYTYVIRINEEQAFTSGDSGASTVTHNMYINIEKE